jgi:hypothetical protein
LSSTNETGGVDRLPFSPAPGSQRKLVAGLGELSLNRLIKSIRMRAFGELGEELPVVDVAWDWSVMSAESAESLGSGRPQSLESCR